MITLSQSTSTSSTSSSSSSSDSSSLNTFLVALLALAKPLLLPLCESGVNRPELASESESYASPWAIPALPIHEPTFELEERPCWACSSANGFLVGILDD